MSVSSLGQATSSAEVWRLLQAQRVSSGTSGTESAGGYIGATGGADRARFSPMAQRMGNLNELAESDPETFKSLTTDMAEKLKALADEATDETEKARLTEMSEKFAAAAESGDAKELMPPPPPPPPGGAGFAFDTGSQTDLATLLSAGDSETDTTSSISDQLRSLLDQFDEAVTNALAAHGEKTTSSSSTDSGLSSQLAQLFKDFDQSVASAVS